MKYMIKELIEYRHLLWMLTWRDIRIRYKQTVMGFAWVLFTPILYVGAGLIISRFTILDTGNMPYPLFMLIGVLPWTFLVSALKFSTISLVNNINLITKIYFPREVLPISAIGACLVDFFISSLIAGIALLYYSINGQASLTIWVIFVPIVILIQVMFIAGLSLLLSMANLFYRDIKYIIDGILTVGIFATAVYYPLNGVFLLNPMNPILNAYRDLLAYGREPDWIGLGYALIISATVLLVGWTCFHKGEFLFAENI